MRSLAPAPIFAVKRPRQALVAHPSNYTSDNAQTQPGGDAALQVQVQVQVRHL